MVNQQKGVQQEEVVSPSLYHFLPKRGHRNHEKIIWAGTGIATYDIQYLAAEEEDGQIVSLGDSRIKCVRDRIAILSMLTVRV